MQHSYGKVSNGFRLFSRLLSLHHLSTFSNRLQVQYLNFNHLHPKSDIKIGINQEEITIHFPYPQNIKMKILQVVHFFTIVALSNPVNRFESRDSTDLGQEDYPGWFSYWLTLLVSLIGQCSLAALGYHHNENHKEYVHWFKKRFVPSPSFFNDQDLSFSRQIGQLSSF